MNANPHPHSHDRIAPIRPIRPVTSRSDDRLAAAAAWSRQPGNARFVADGDGDSHGLVPNLDTPWLDIAEQRLHELLDGEEVTLPPEMAGLLDPGQRDQLRTRLWATLRAEHLDPVPGVCAMPWTGCPEHGDLMEHSRIVPGWSCTMPGHDFTIEDTLERLRHCPRPAIAVCDR